MQFSEELVNQVVANVLSTLTREGQGKTATGSVPALKPTDNSIELTEKVITADLLAEKARGAASISVAAGSLLTPSAKDYLREFRISVNQTSASKAPAAKQGTPWRAIVLNNSLAVENALSTIEQQTGVSWSRELSSSLEESVKEAISSICRADATGVVLFVSAAEKAACLANRNEKVCAAAVQDVNHLRSVITQMNPNLICVNPEQKSFMELRNLMKVFVNAG